jgi:hypothetical protein
LSVSVSHSTYLLHKRPEISHSNIRNINRPLKEIAMAQPSIDELMEILNNEESQEIEILPNGEIRQKGGSSPRETGGKKPLTMREDLGGEYAQWTR